MRMAGIKHTLIDFEAGLKIKGISGLLELGVPEEEIKKCIANEKEIHGKSQLFFIQNGDVFTIKKTGTKWVCPYFEVVSKIEKDNSFIYLIKTGNKEILVDQSDNKSLAKALGTLTKVVGSAEFAEFFAVQSEKAVTKTFIDSLGWHKDIFIHPAFVSDDVYIHIENDIKDALLPKNTEKQHEIVKEILKKDPILAIKIVCATASLFMSRGGFVVVEVGERGSGKTLSSEFVMNLFYNHELINTSSYTTTVGMEISLKRLKNFPILADEMALTKDEKMEFIVFMLASGSGKTRGTKDLKISFSKLANVLFTTSERDMVETRFGVKRRVLYLYPKLLGGYRINPEKLVEYKEVGSGCAIDYIRYILQQGKENFDKNIVAYPSLPWTRRVSQAIDLLQKFYNVDLQETISILDETLSKQEKENKIETDSEAYSDLMEFLEIHSDKEKNEVQLRNTKGEIWFKRDETTGDIFILKSVFQEKFLKEFCKGKYSEKIILNTWREKGILSCRNYPNMTETVRFQGAVVRCYHIVLKSKKEEPKIYAEEDIIEPF